MTWLSYNRWPQWRSLYDLGTRPWGASNGKVGYDVGFDRPYALFWNGYPAGFHPLTNGSGEFLMTEFPLAFWLEKEGYDVTYISNVDTHADANGLLRAKAFLSVGHDEYWTERMFDNVTRARDAGVSLAFLSGNSISGVVELLPSTDGRPNRVMRRAGRGFQGEQELMGSTLVRCGVRRLDQRQTRTLGVRGHEHEEGRSRGAARRLGIPRSSPRQAPGSRRAVGRAGVRRQRARSAPARTPRRSTPRPKATSSSTRRPAGGTWCCRLHPDFRTRRARTSSATTRASSGLRRTSSTG